MVISQNEIDNAFEVIITEVINLYLIPKFEELGMEATGEWIENVHSKGSELWGRDYTKYLVEGRPPNDSKDPKDIAKFARWAGATFIGKWVQDKGLDLNPFAVAYKIAMEGTNYYPDGTDLMEILESNQVTEYINMRLKELLVPLQGDKFRDYVINTFNRK